MNTEQLKTLLDQRFHLLEKLLEQSQHQLQCIAQNRMTDLMQLLSDRQRLIENLTRVSKQLNAAVGDDPRQRTWNDPAEQEVYRNRQVQCDRMHQELLAIEAECESMLQENRAEIESEIQRFNRGSHAVSSYQQSQWQGQTVTTDTSGGTLDLSQ